MKIRFLVCALPAALLLPLLYTASSARLSHQASASTSPSQIRIFFGEDPTTMARVVWQTQAPVASQVVEFGTTENLGLSSRGWSPSYELQTGSIAEASLQNLKPNTKYFYRVGDPTGGWSKIHSFRTGAKDPAVFSFTAFGDHGISPEAAKNVENIVAEKPSFHYLLGDISYANGNQPIWDKYLDQVEPLTSSIPTMLTLGNHENEEIKVGDTEKSIGYISYLARFALPGHEKWYSFDYGVTRFVAFNSDDYSNAEQLDWLRRTLSEACSSQKIKWIIVAQHHPLYGSSKGRGDNLGLIKTVMPIYDLYKVDLVLTGHDHHYERQFPLRNGRAVTAALTGYKKGEGTLYVTQGGGGKALYDFSDPKPDVCAVREKSHGYLRITVRKKGGLTVESKRLDGSLIEKIDVRD